MGMFPEAKEYVKVPKFVVKATNVQWDSYYNYDTNKWGGLLKASMLTEEETKSKELPVNGEVVSYDKVVGLA